MVTATVFEVPAGQDAVDFCFARGWTDGLPAVPPTEDRVLRMLAGPPRRPDEAAAWTVRGSGRARRLTQRLRGGVRGPMGLGALLIPA